MREGGGQSRGEKDRARVISRPYSVIHFFPVVDDIYAFIFIFIFNAIEGRKRMVIGGEIEGK